MGLEQWSDKTAIWINKDLHKNLMRLKYELGFRSVEEVIKFLVKLHVESDANEKKNKSEN